jgi:hypothetical protein
MPYRQTCGRLFPSASLDEVLLSATVYSGLPYPENQLVAQEPRRDRTGMTLDAVKTRKQNPR